MSSSSSAPRISSSATRRLFLHPSALSDAENALFISGLRELTDDNSGGGTYIDWERVSVSIREARAWICGRYSSLGSGTVDEILRLFSPSPTLSGGAFFAALRLVLHALEGRGVERSLAFVQAPVPVAPSTHTININTSAPPFNPFLPTPAPSPEARARPPLPPRKLTAPTNKMDAYAGSTLTSRFNTSSPASSVSGSTSASSSASSAPPRRAHGYSASLSAASAPALPILSPPTHPLRRASTQRTPSANDSTMQISGSGSSVQNSNPSINPNSNSGLHRKPSNPFRASASARPMPPLPPRRASTSVPTSPFHSPQNSQFAAPINSNPNSHFASPSNSQFASPSNSQFTSPSNSQFTSPQNSPLHSRESSRVRATSAFGAASPFSLTDSNPASNSHANSHPPGAFNNSHSHSPSAFNSRSTHSHTRTPSTAPPTQSTFRANVHPATPDGLDETAESPFGIGYGDATVRVRAPPVHPHRRVTSFEAAYGEEEAAAAASLASLSLNRDFSSSSPHVSRETPTRRVSLDARPRPLRYNSESARRVSEDAGRERERGGRGSFVAAGERSGFDAAREHFASQSRVASASASNTRERDRTLSSGAGITLPKALRRTLAGAGWVGAEPGEREGLMRG